MFGAKARIVDGKIHCEEESRDFRMVGVFALHEGFRGDFGRHVITAPSGLSVYSDSDRRRVEKLAGRLSALEGVDWSADFIEEAFRDSPGSLETFRELMAAAHRTDEVQESAPNAPRA